MSTGNSSDGVGKKIVEALKKQHMQQQMDLYNSKENLNPTSNNFTNNNPTQQQQQEVNDFQSENINLENKNIDDFSWDYESTFDDSSLNISDKNNLQIRKLPPIKEFDIPSNVLVLKNLIKQLPQGVSKQTGAQIIRQTLEALGISMKSVLSEAQNIQDELNEAIKECMTSVQEYKETVVQLEKQAQDYQKQVANINDLISLFILTEEN